MQVESAPARSLNRGLRSVARTILWPLRRFFDPRFIGVHDAVQDVKRIMVADIDAKHAARVLLATWEGLQVQWMHGPEFDIRSEIAAVIHAVLDLDESFRFTD